MPDRARLAPLLDTFRFSAAYACTDLKGFLPVPMAATLAGAPLPKTSRTHPDRNDLTLSAIGPMHVQVSSARAARRPANWVRKLQALHAALDNPLLASSSTLLPGASPFASQASQENDAPLCMRLGLRLELPFSRPSDFGKLMAAVRVALPLIPAISASTPFNLGKSAGLLSYRLRCWLDEYARFPERVGGFIPEAFFDQADHDREVLGPIAQAMGRLGRTSSIDPQALDWRAATVLVEPDAIALHAIDMQECPAADMAVLEFIIAVLRALTSGRWVSSYLQRAWSTDDLMAIMGTTVASGGQAIITNRDYLLMFGLMKREEMPAAKLLQHLFVELYGELSENARTRMGVIVEHGELAARMIAHAGKKPSAERMRALCASLAACRSGSSFR